MKNILILSTVLAMASLNSCKDSETTATTAENTPSTDFSKYFTEEEIADAQDIHVARTTAKPGDEITLKGEAMGLGKVFVDGRASFILGDPTKLTTCDKIPGDACETPWDACCDSKELKRVGIASIQIVDEDGRVLEGDIKGVNGLKEISKVTVTGTVAENSTEDNLIVNAEKIRVE